MAWKTTDDPRTEFVTLRLTASEAADLDAYRAARGQSRSQALRDALDEKITRWKKQHSKRAARKKQTP